MDKSCRRTIVCMLYQIFVSTMSQRLTVSFCFFPGSGYYYVSRRLRCSIEFARCSCHVLGSSMSRRVFDVIRESAKREQRAKTAFYHFCSLQFRCSTISQRASDLPVALLVASVKYWSLEWCALGDVRNCALRYAFDMHATFLFRRPCSDGFRSIERWDEYSIVESFRVVRLQSAVA